MQERDAYYIRLRMENDLRHNASMMRSELECYGNCFSPAQQAKIKSLVTRMNSLADSVACYKTIVKE